MSFNIISNNDDKQDANAAVRGFRIFRAQEFFKRIEKNNFIIWADCGKHFRNSTFIGYLFKELKAEGIYGIINVNFYNFTQLNK